MNNIPELPPPPEPSDLYGLSPKQMKIYSCVTNTIIVIAIISGIAMVGMGIARLCGLL